jgi:hypothetical protein
MYEQVVDLAKTVDKCIASPTFPQKTLLLHIICGTVLAKLER